MLSDMNAKKGFALYRKVFLSATLSGSSSGSGEEEGLKDEKTALVTRDACSNRCLETSAQSTATGPQLFGA